MHVSSVKLPGNSSWRFTARSKFRRSLWRAKIPNPVYRAWPLAALLAFCFSRRSFPDDFRPSFLRTMRLIGQSQSCLRLPLPYQLTGSRFYGQMSFRTELCFTGIVSDDKSMPRFDRFLVLTESQFNLQNVIDPQSGLALLMKRECIPSAVWGKSICTRH